MSQSKQCEFCPNSKKDYYTCPKCNAPYCSLKCYRSPEHLQCTETFYKQCVQDEMRLLSKSSEAKRKTVEALKNNLKAGVNILPFFLMIAGEKFVTI